MAPPDWDDATSAAQLRVDVWSDVACPWCYIGKRRLEMGIERFSSQVEAAPAVAVEFHSFELNPGMPEDFEGTAADYLSRHKGIPVEAARRAQEQVSEIAATVGLGYRFDIQKPANTAKAHQLLHVAKREGRQLDVKERLLRAHFVEGRHIGRGEVLVDIAGEAGIDGAEATDALAADAFLADVRADEDLARRLGIGGVPFFVFGGKYAVSGAQEPEVMVEVLVRSLAEQTS